MFRRCLIVLSLLVAFSGALPAAALAVAAAEYETLSEITARWYAYRAPLKDLPREERLAKAKAFFQTISWEQIRWICGEESASLGPDQNMVLSGFVDGKLRSGGAKQELIAELIADLAANSVCQEAIIKFLSTHRDSIAALPEAELYGQAMLDLADSGARGELISFKLEQGAVFFKANAGLLARMLRYSRSEDTRIAKHGVEMLRSSRDELAADSLLALAREMMASGRHPRVLDRALLGLSEHCSDEVFDFLLDLYRQEKKAMPSRLPRDELMAMARCQNPRLYPILLAEYGDEAGIADSTHAIADKELKKRYWNLWYFTRLAEPGIIEGLAGDREEAFLAAELLDRASRFGLPASREELLLPLAAWGERRGGQWQERISLIVNRFRSYPDPIER